MKILLVGATGTLGRQIAKQAIEEGHEVRCFVEIQENRALVKNGVVS